MSVLCVSAETSISSARVAGTAAAESEGTAPEHEALAEVHRSALKAYVFLLHWLMLQLEKVSRLHCQGNIRAWSSRPSYATWQEPSLSKLTCDPK